MPSKAVEAIINGMSESIVEGQVTCDLARLMKREGREDVNEVFAAIREIGDGLKEDETYGPDILEPLEIQGVNALGASSVDIRARIKTKPLKQWALRREFFRRMKRDFDERGIEIPFPHQTIYFGVDKEGAAPPARVALERATAETTAAAKAPRESTAPAATAPVSPDTPTEPQAEPSGPEP